MNWKQGFGLGLMAVVATVGLRAEEQRLRYKLTEGMVLRYRETIEGTGEFPHPMLAGEVVLFRLRGRARREWRVEEVVPGPRFRIDSRLLEGTLQGMMGEQEETPPYPPAHLFLEMSDAGRIARARSRLPRNQTGKPLNLLGFPLDPHTLFHSFLTVGLPEKPVAPGTAWLDQQIPLLLDDGSEAQGRIHTRLRKMETYRGQNCAAIETEFALPVATRTEWQGVPVAMQGSLTGKTTIHLAVDRGVILHAVGTLHMEWTLTGLDSGDGISSQPVPVKMILNLETNLEEPSLNGRKLAQTK